MKFYQRLFVITTALFFTACANVPKQAFNKEGNSHINSITLTQYADEDEYSASVIAHTGSSFGLIGALVAAADMSTKSGKLTKAVDPAATQITKKFTERLQSALVKSGYNVEIAKIPAKTAFPDAAAIAARAKPSDAVLNMFITASYVAAGSTTDYFPFLLVKIQKTDNKAGKVVYEDSLSYGYTTSNSQFVHFASEPQYRFPNIDKLIEAPDVTRQGWLAGFDALINQITDDLRKK
jgi:hypothetical protein